VAILDSIACKFSLASIVEPKIEVDSCFANVVSSNTSMLEVFPVAELTPLVNKVEGTAIPTPLLDIAGGIGGSLAANPATEAGLAPIENPILMKSYPFGKENKRML
jgi:hypothetical protein